MIARPVPSCARSPSRPCAATRLAFGDAQHGGEHDFGDFGQRARGGDGVEPAAEEGQADAEQRGLAHFLDQLDLRFGIGLAERGETACQLLLDFAPRRRGLVDAIVEQVVEQQRMGDHAIGEEGAGREHAAEPPQRRRLFVEQGQIHRTACDRVRELEQARQRSHRLGLCRRRGEQRRHHAVEAFARTRRHVAQGRAAEQGFQFGGGFLRRIEAGRGERARVDAVAAVERAPQLAPLRLGLLRGAARLDRHQRAELLGDRGAVFLQFALQRGPAIAVERQREALADRRVRRNLVRLLVGEHLHAVFQPAQEAVGRAQPLRARRGNEAELLAGGQRRQQAARAQGRLAAAADQLHQLHDELDLADAARTELEMVGQILARDLGVDQRLHLAQAGEGAVVEIAAEHERPQRVEQARAGAAVAGDRPRLDPGVALPVAAFTLEVLLHRGERQRHAAGAAERTQAQVDAVDVAVGVVVGEQRDQRLADARVVGAGVERTGAVAVAVFGEGEHDVDVGGEVQLAAAELAEREHHQALRLPVRVTHDTVARGDLAFGAAQSRFDAGLGQHRGAGQRGLDRVGAVDVAPDQAQRLATAEMTQLGAQLVVVQIGQRAGARVGVARIAHQLQQFRLEQARIAQEALVGEVAGQQHALQVVVDAGVVVERHAGLTAGVLEPRQAFVEEGGGRARPVRLRKHARIVAAGSC